MTICLKQKLLQNFWPTTSNIKGLNEVIVRQGSNNIYIDLTTVWIDKILKLRYFKYEKLYMKKV